MRKTLTEEQRNKVVEAVRVFCNWQGKAVIMYDESDNDCWCDVFHDDNSCKVYKSDTIYSIFSKDNFWGRNERARQSGIIEIIEKKLYKNKDSQEAIVMYGSINY